MNLKTLELFGFKSFMRKLDIHFSDGITVIVGPNGCGKTNVTDALRWVLGEANARMLRGNRMEDLIFNGTRDYKPLNVAEVSLTVDNSRGILPIDYTEVTVTRRVFRNGESEFLINRIPGRLKDIHDLFMDTGLGSRAYSVIERDMVEMVLADAPEKRRELLEEAAGIMKYKIRERQARRKLEATDDDLKRLQDVLHEVDRQVRALKRQVGAAQRFQEMRDRLRGLDVALAATEVDALNHEEERLAASLAESVTERDGAAGRVAAFDADIETRRLKAAEADAALAEAQRSVDALAETARKVESDNLVRRERRESLLDLGRRMSEEARVLGERVAAAIARRSDLERELAARGISEAQQEAALAELERSLAAVESDLTERRAALGRAREAAEETSRDVGSRRTDLANLDAHEAHLADRAAVLDEEARGLAESAELRGRELAGCEERAEALRRDVSRIAAEIEAREARRQELDRERDAVREEEARLALELESTRSGLEMLRALRDAHEGFGQGARSLLARGRASALSDALRVTREDLLGALDAALGAGVELVVVGNGGDALSEIRSLQSGEGRATVVDRAALARAEREAAPFIPSDPSIVGRAHEFLHSPDELSPIVDRLLSRAVIVETLEDAVRLAQRADGRHLRFVARSGEWAEYPGVVHGGASRAEDPRILGRADRIASLERRTSELEGRRADAHARSGQAGAAREEISLELDRLHAERDARREALAAEERGLERSRAERSGLVERRAAVEEERRAVETRRGEVGRDRAARRTAVDDSTARHQRAEDECRRREDELVASSEERERRQHSVHDLRLELARAKSERERVAAEIERLEAARVADEEGIARRAEETAATDRQVGELARAIEEGFAEFGRLAEELERERSARDDVGRGRTSVMEELGAFEAERQRWTRLRDEAGQAVHDVEMRVARLDADRRETCARVEREFSVDLRLPGAIAAHGELLGVDDEALAEARRERDDLRVQLDRMGAVNLVALEQYERESKRYEFLKTQHDDLEEAREKLRQTIRRINRKARALFMDTLEKVRANFQQTFGTLFEGGQADVRLVGDEDPLHAPIEIFARPRGKRLSNISLLSSGERSLTAVSFLFAIYLVKPSPFCILDEVDAPLDDANIGRFLQMLRKVAERTQFVMITHNKKTMEIADYLYGVTMEEPGVSKLVSVHLGKGAGGGARERGRGGGGACRGSGPGGHCLIGKLGARLARLREGLAKTRARLGDGIRALVAGRSGFDESTWEGIEEVLLGADVGAASVEEIVADLKRAASGWSRPDPERIFEELRRSIGTRLASAPSPLMLEAPGGPAVVLVVGVNGSGKTTTIGKLAARLAREGRRVLVVAADTYRAAAVEQMAVWAERAGVPIVKGTEGADAAAVVHDGLAAAIARGIDVVLVDTAGRLHTKTSLMEELAKVRRVAARQIPGAPHEVLLVLDATTGQNGVRQAEAFSKSLGVTGLVLAKLDGTAKGGVVLAIRRALDLPVKLVGVGEGIEDLETFDPVAFAAALVPAAPVEGEGS